CNDSCQQAGALLALASHIPEHVVQQHVWQVHQGICPKCQGPGPIDVHTSYRVWSALIMTSWSNRPQVSCRSCGRKRQLADAGLSLVFGWWGFPWGLIMTPVQVVRNVAGLARTEESAQPSSQLDKIVRMQLAAHVVAEQSRTGQ